MSSEITLEQIEERLIQALKIISFKAIASRDKDLENTYTALNRLLLDIQVSKPKPNPRDTQFKGFAHALLLQLAQENALTLNSLNWDRFFGELELTVARRAYDLTCHTIRSQAQGMDRFVVYDSEWMQERVELVTDMTEWPKEQEG